MFASDIRHQRVNRMKGFRHWHWHLDEMYVKLNGEMVYPLPREPCRYALASAATMKSFRRLLNSSETACGK